MSDMPSEHDPALTSSTSAFPPTSPESIAFPAISWRFTGTVRPSGCSGVDHESLSASTRADQNGSVPRARKEGGTGAGAAAAASVATSAGGSAGAVVSELAATALSLAALVGPLARCGEQAPSDIVTSRASADSERVVFMSALWPALRPRRNRGPIVNAPAAAVSATGRAYRATRRPSAVREGGYVRTGP